MHSALKRLVGPWVILAGALLLAMLVAHSNLLVTAENGQQAVVSQVLNQEASQQIHIVEVDAKSIAAARQWPWSRERHARLVDQLNAAGARSITFDIDFSSHFTPDGDAAFADAIARSAARVVMPTFGQFASEQSLDRIDALPIPELRDHASLASASVLPDRDARVRRMLFGSVTDGLARPSLSSQIAGVSGEAFSSYPIDYSINPATIPRHSFIDVEAGQFDASSVKGKDVIVGATAIELGDRYGVPVYGVIPGVTIQALAAETLMAGGLFELGIWPLLLVALAVGVWVLRQDHYRDLAVRATIGMAVLIVLQIIAYHAFSAIAALMPAALALTAMTIAQGVRIAFARFRAKSLLDEESGMPNALALMEAEHTPDQFIAVAFIKDFDSLQTVLGKNEIGSLIRRLSERLEALSGAPTLYRIDARILAWVHTSDDGALIEVFEKIEKAMLKPIEAAGKRVDVQLAFGIAAEDNLSAASSAASKAAKTGKLWHAHEAAEAAILEQRVSLMGELDLAIDRGELQMVYQPKMKLSTNRIESVEALVRWNHPERGFLRPDLFIPLAEQSNRIERLTLFSIEQCIADLKTWMADGADISAAVNISARLVSSEDFINKVEAMMVETGIPRDHLIFEVTESATMSDPDLAAKNLTRLRDLGVHISMDDYGTGQSTLSYLQLLPLTELKIDRAFVQHAHRERSDALLVRSTVQLAHSLGLRVVGEGVEDQACLDFLRKVGCDYAQGYHISKPLPASQVAPQLARAEKPAEQAA